MTKNLKKLNIRLKSQSILELTLALVAVFILILGTVKIFVWLNRRMALRQQAYERTRLPRFRREEIYPAPGPSLTPGSPGPGGTPEVEVYIYEEIPEVDESGLPPLDIFDER